MGALCPPSGQSASVGSAPTGSGGKWPILFLFRTLGLDKPKVVVLLFGSGKLVVTGGKKPKDAEDAVERIVSELAGLALI